MKKILHVYISQFIEGLWQLQQIYEAFRHPEATLVVDARRVRDITNAHDLLRRLDRASKGEKKRIILNLSSSEVYQTLLNQVITHKH